ncbi:hypothetical protein GGS23DRAFT_262385 [Durotheca rogersii]|uniref:uncharacterized protein n=1 Tax=Durotheca rogersii TaxID=419775 RepID=UPI00221F5C2A|nr:uncharacterized protein GGS23DRAFT_262385 [Durotheca rogersii]KAI5859818.1 hypothetical protein GGS23DRAFT_262385 [Durotheca rogersii]
MHLSPTALRIARVHRGPCPLALAYSRGTNLVWLSLAGRSAPTPCQLRRRIHVAGAWPGPHPGSRRAASTAAAAAAAVAVPSASLNPPASTRPPPLELPVRADSGSIFAHLYRLGKAYTVFYKAGLRAIFTNRKLARSLPRSSSPSSLSRADILLRERSRHDLSRLPLFGLLVLVCGELTPLVVLLFPHLTPYTCRIPRQVDGLRRTAEARRAASFRNLAHHLQSASSPDAVAPSLANRHICRALWLTLPLWDRVGLAGPFAGPLARRAVSRLATDDALLRGGGGPRTGVASLVDDEVVLACEDRGIDVRGRDTAALRADLEDWLRRTAPTLAAGKGGEEAWRTDAERRIRAALLGLDGARK